MMNGTIKTYLVITMAYGFAGTCWAQDDGTAAVQHRPVALLEVLDAVGERCQRQRVRPEIHLAVAITDRQRATAPRADHHA